MRHNILITEEEKNQILNLHKGIIKEQYSTQNQTELYGENTNGVVHWSFSQYNNDPSVTYNVSITCKKGCQGGDKDFSFNLTNATNDSKVGLYPFDKINYRDFELKVDAVKEGKVIATATKMYGKDYGVLLSGFQKNTIKPTFQTPAKPQTTTNQTPQQDVFGSATPTTTDNTRIVDDYGTQLYVTDVEAEAWTKAKQANPNLTIDQYKQSLSQQQAGTQQPSTQPTPIQLGVKNDKVVTIQTKLNEKIAAKQIPNVTSPLVVDGKWGPNTAYAITQFL
jgi:hypothetical protein